MDLNGLVKLSENLLLACKLNENTENLRNTLEHLKLSDLKNLLNNDDAKKTFWINIYNAYFLILRKELKLEKPDIYRKKVFIIAGKKFSLDDVEHGILRKYRYKYSLGFFANIFYSRLIKTLAVAQIDYRIHFALNCGAKSCPPIAFYNVLKINEQLNLATQSFLEGETKYDETSKKVYLTSLFKWYLIDFDGIKGIRKIYKEQMNKNIDAYKIIYTKYSWDEDLNNFTTN